MSKKQKPLARPIEVQRDTATSAAMMIWDVPESVRRDFKSKCAQNGRHMKDVLIEFMTAYAAGK